MYGRPCNTSSLECPASTQGDEWHVHLGVLAVSCGIMIHLPPVGRVLSGSLGGGSDAQQQFIAALPLGYRKAPAVGV